LSEREAARIGYNKTIRERANVIHMHSRSHSHVAILTVLQISVYGVESRLLLGIG
jgi:hypothetical protein